MIILLKYQEISKMLEENIKEKRLNKSMTMIYWKEKKFWPGKFLEHPEIMTQGLTLEELESNLKDAYLMMAMDDVPETYTPPAKTFV